MIAAQRWPANTVGGCDFVTGLADIRPGERIVDLECDLDALPAWGQLAIHENTVRNLNRALGWPTVEDYEQLAAALATARADADLQRQALAECQRDKAEAESALAAIAKAWKSRPPANSTKATA